MLSSRSNVLLLTVDTWRADRLSVYGYSRPTTPALDRFAENAIVCRHASTLSPYTQPACVQLFTSSRPLSYGGYDRGAVGRPTTLFKHFRNAGWRTFGLSTIDWVSPYYGYGDAFDESGGTILLNALVGAAVANMRDTLRLYGERRIERDHMLSIAVPVVRRLFESVELYSTETLRRSSTLRHDFPDAKPVTDSYDLDRVSALVRRHRENFERDPTEYIERHLLPVPQPHEWLAAEWHLYRSPLALANEALFRFSNRLVALFNPKLAALRSRRFRPALDAHAIADKLIRWLHDHDTDRPFFIWAHFKDTHQPYVAGPGRQWYRHVPSILATLGYPGTIDAGMAFHAPRVADDMQALSALYDTAVWSTDDAMGQILAALDTLNLTDSTVVGICGDHGEELGEHGDYGHLTMHYEHNTRIPMLFRRGRGEARRIDGLASSLDFAPTVAMLAEISPADGWEGGAVTSEPVARRDEIVLETFCRGNCDFDYRPLYMGVRTRTHKYLWKEYQDPTHATGTSEPELYDLESDPDETKNLYHSRHHLVPAMNATIIRRLTEIPEIRRERIHAAFDPILHDPIV